MTEVKIVKILMPSNFRLAMESMRKVNAIDDALECMITITAGLSILHARAAWTQKDFDELQKDIDNAMETFNK